MKWKMKTYTLIDSCSFLAYGVWERAVCICFSNPWGDERSRWWDSNWSSGTPANWVLFSREKLVQSTAVFSTLFFRGEFQKLLAEKDLALDFFSPLLNLCFVILQWPRGEIKQFSFKNNCLAWLKKAVCVFYNFVFTFFGWFCFSVQLYCHTVEAYLLYPIYLSIWGFHYVALSVLELSM